MLTVEVHPNYNQLAAITDTRLVHSTSSSWEQTFGDYRVKLFQLDKDEPDWPSSYQAASVEGIPLFPFGSFFHAGPFWDEKRITLQDATFSYVGKRTPPAKKVGFTVLQSSKLRKEYQDYVEFGASAEKSNNDDNFVERSAVWHPYIRLQRWGTGASHDVNSLEGTSYRTGKCSDAGFISAQLPHVKDAYFMANHGGMARGIDVYFGGALQGAESELWAMVHEMRMLETQRVLNKRQIVDIGSTVANVEEVWGIFTKGSSTILPFLKRVINAEKHAGLNPIQVVKELAGSWLEFSYGLKPLFGTISDLKKGIDQGKLGKTVYEIRAGGYSGYAPRIVLRNRQTFHGNVLGWQTLDEDELPQLVNVADGGVTQRRTIHRHSYGSPVEEVYVDPVNSMASPSGPALLQLDTEVVFRTKDHWAVTCDWKDILFQLGLSSVLVPIHERLKFSFILDWFWKVGDMLTARSNADGLTFNESLSCVQANWTVTSSWGGSGRASYYKRVDSLARSPSQYDGHWLDRPVINRSEYSPPAPSLGRGTLITSANALSRGANAAALLVVLLPQAKGAIERLVTAALNQDSRARKRDTKLGGAVDILLGSFTPAPGMEP